MTAAPPPRFLLDENLSPALVELARVRGYEAMAVRDLGLLSERDWDLLPLIEQGDWTFVTINVHEFRVRYRRRLALHAGVVFLQGVAGVAAQATAFDVALDDIDRSRELTNTEILVERLGPTRFRISRSDLP
jgi:hypothetical protein